MRQKKEVLLHFHKASLYSLIPITYTYMLPLPALHTDTPHQHFVYKTKNYYEINLKIVTKSAGKMVH
jgi:hypothetical protein